MPPESRREASASLRLPLVEEPPVPAGAPDSPRWALLALGFRPFYLAASGQAALSLVLWGLQLHGLLPRPVLAGPLWHAHELLFGFVLAVIVGFLFTAGRNWTGQPTPAGPALAALVGLWLAGRIAVLAPWPVAAALVNVAFPLAAAAGLAVPLVRARNRRNFFLVGILVLLAAAQAVFHGAALGVGPAVSPAAMQVAMQVALDLVLVVMAVIAGRVMPMFTRNGVPGTTPRTQPGLERAALALLPVLVVADALQAGATVVMALAGTAAALHLLRWLGWQPWRTLRVPLVAVLHVGYAWIWLHLALRAAAAAGLVAGSTATHALTAGAIGTLVIAMMTRTARGHTGRPLRADGVDVACYALVVSAAVVRVVLPLAAPTAMLPAITLSAVLWSAGFGLYALRYGPWLARPRVEGRPE